MSFLLMHQSSQKTKIAIIGAGFGGLAMAIRLLQSGIQDFIILEKADDVGGTWRENQYPGAACDVQSHMYSLSFAPKKDWSKRYAEAPEIFDYIQDLIKELVDGQGLADTLCKFWGLYIFEHLSQRFEEKIQQQKGEEVSKETFKIIKDDILGRVKVLNTQRAVSKIDWNKAEGRKEIEKIFDSIIKIICNEKN